MQEVIPAAICKHSNSQTFPNLLLSHVFLSIHTVTVRVTFSSSVVYLQNVIELALVNLFVIWTDCDVFLIKY